MPPTPDTIDSTFMERCITHQVAGCVLVDVRVDAGFGAHSLMTEVIRIELTHSSDDCGPRSVVVKVPLAVPTASGSGVYRREANVYHDLLSPADLPVPKFHSAVPVGQPEDLMVVLEDVSGARIRKQTDALSPAEAIHAVQAIARVHAKFWLNERVPALDPPDELEERWGSKVRTSWDGFIERYGPQLGEDRSGFEWVRDHTLEVFQHRDGSPWTLLHGDFQPENVLLTPNPARPVVIIDWQLSGAGAGVHDLAIVLTVGLSVEDMRQDLGTLLRRYHEALTGSRRIDYPFEAMFRDFRAAVTNAMAKIVMKAGGFGGRITRPDALEVADANFERTLATVRELDPVDAMKEVLDRR